MYLEWIKWVFVIMFVVGAAWVGYIYLYEGGPQDGDPCQRDVDCPERSCLETTMGRYCSRICNQDSECRPGWRCLRAVGRTTTYCIQPSH